MIPKFRAYFSEYNRMLEVIEIVRQDMISVDFAGYGNLESLFVTDKIHVMQSTGLFDKNGKEIFEGDIVKNINTGSVGRVYWDVHNTGFSYNVKRQDQALFDSYTIFRANFNLEVIGNIYENPELLKKR